MDQPIFEKVLSVIKDLVADNGTDAVSLLKADHRKVEGLFKRNYEKIEDNDDKRAILQQIIKELTVHTTVEESKVYPILEHKDVEGSNEAYEEHHLVKVILDELVNDVASPLTDAKVKALSELVKHHVQEEELELLLRVAEYGYRSRRIKVASSLKRKGALELKVRILQRAKM